MAYESKFHLRTVKDRPSGTGSHWYMFIDGRYRLQLCGDSSRWWFWIKQYAERLGKYNLMKDLTEVFALMESEWASPFTLYKLPALWKSLHDIRSPQSPQ